MTTIVITIVAMLGIAKLDRMLDGCRLFPPRMPHEWNDPVPMARALPRTVGQRVGVFVVQLMLGDRAFRIVVVPSEACSTPTRSLPESPTTSST